MCTVAARFVPTLGSRLLPVRSTSLRSSVRTRAIRSVCTATMSGSPALVVWLHGLGDSGAGWSDLQHMLGPKLPHVKWAFPNAPVQPVACNMGMKMPSWFDLPTIPLQPGCEEDAAAFQQAVTAVHALVRDEMQKTGVPAERVVLGGFSQGGAIAVQATLAFPEKLAGGVCFSGWLVDANGVGGRIDTANKETPLLWCHGDADPTVVAACQKEGIEVLGGLGVPLTHLSYKGMGHSACNSEFEDLHEWLITKIPA